MEEMKEMEFDPRIFGFDIKTMKNDRGERRYQHKDYVLFGPNCKDGRLTKATLVLSEETSDVVGEMFGERVGLSIRSDDGAIVIYKGNSRKLTKPKNVVSGLRRVSLETHTSELQRGEKNLRRVVYDAKIWAKGQAILLTPTEDKEYF